MQISYYQLSGRPFSGSNIKVRLGDKQLPGLGVEVCNGKMWLNANLEPRPSSPRFYFAALEKTPQFFSKAAR